MKEERKTPELTPPTEPQLDGARIISIDPVIDDIIKKLTSEDPNITAKAIDAINHGKLHSHFLIDPLIQVAILNPRSMAQEAREVAITNGNLASHLLSDYGTTAVNAMTRALIGRDVYQQSLLVSGIYNILTDNEGAQINYSSTPIIAEEGFLTTERSRTPLGDRLLMDIGSIFEYLTRHPNKVVSDSLDGADSAAQTACMRIAERLKAKG